MRTHSSILSLAFLSLSLFACAPGGYDVDSYDDTDEGADERGDAIVGGSAATAYPEAVLIDMKQGGSVVAICSGTLIAPKVVLTAGHCVHGFDGWNIKAPFASNQTASASASAVYDWTNDSEFVDPNQHDVGLIFLSKPITIASYPTIATAALAANAKVQNIGRINNGQASNTKLFIGPQVATKKGAAYGFPFDYVTAETIQSGDSGGPVVVPGTHKLVAVNSGAGGGTQVLARVDLVAPWIAEKVAQAGSAAPAQPPADPCNGIDYAGTCQGSTVVWCENNKLSQINCASSGKTCGFDSANSYYNCL